MGGNSVAELCQVGFPETVVLHRQLLQVLILLHDARDVVNRYTSDLVPGDIEEL